MPTPDQILDGLHAIANRWTLLAMVWHVYFALLLLALWFARRPSRRHTAALLTLPLLCVSVLAWGEANPFNGVVFLVGALALAACARRLPAERVAPGPRWTRMAGLLVIGFGWGYPHFLEAASPLAYLYAAPTGLVPCPTLAIVIGVTLLEDGLGSRLWSGMVSGLGLSYGLFGGLYLGVVLDWGLVVGALLLIARLLTRGS
ncbi:hypothetical protein [Halomonas nitroreducens]|uniref:Uncharacterized protein n=1 Tax=Halomonas nitroreducens TaxID=447425 RepID=A0A431V814_9GAMM|nr:hypothetical protein [Halomonas nitroreducens]RTR06535.1 hypothetical protein EKG36_03430 [Halomonas nitroreducens]